jgi:hypothetical protein
MLTGSPSVLTIEVFVLIRLFENEVVEYNEVEDDFLQVDNQQVLILYWFVFYSTLETEMHQKVVNGP